MSDPERLLYRLRLPSVFLAGERLDVSLRNVGDSDDVALGQLMEAAYAGTIDEDLGDNADGLIEIQDWRANGGDPTASVVAVDPTGVIVAASLITAIDDKTSLLGYVITAPERKRDGVATAVVSLSLVELAVRGTQTVIAAVTVGNVASERLMSRFGFVSVSV